MREKRLPCSIAAFALLAACGPPVDPDTCPPADDPGCTLTDAVYIRESYDPDTRRSLQALCDTHCAAVSALVLEAPDLKHPSELRILSKFRKITSLRIRENSELVDLQGLENLVEVGSFMIEDNPKLVSLRGLTNLKAVRGEFGITSNRALASLDGLDSLESIGLALGIGGNASLESLDGFPRLRVPEPGISLSVNGNESLLRLGSLGSPTRLRSVFIADNPNLRSLDDLSALEHASLSIYFNARLPQCAVDAFAARVDPTASRTSLTPNNPGGVCE